MVSDQTPPQLTFREAALGVPTLQDLRRYRSDAAIPADFDEFWAGTIAEMAGQPLAAEFVPFECGLDEFEVYDVRYSGWAGDRIAAWLIVPRRPTTSPRPVVVSYVGYGSGRGFAHQWLPFAAAGRAAFVMDTRGQGSEFLPGVTPDPQLGQGPQAPGFVTAGVLNRDSYYYRRVFADAWRAVDCARAFDQLHDSPVAVQGVSQGGGIALAVAGLRTDLAGAMIDVPFLLDWRRAVDLATEGPYGELLTYLSVHRGSVEKVFRTLAYFDGVAFAERARARARFSVGLRDVVCPPSTVFAAYNAYAGEKDISVWPYNGHEGGVGTNLQEQINWLTEQLRW